jgi:hypothetical protein
MPECRARVLTLVIAFIFVAVFHAVAQTTPPASAPLYLDPSLPLASNWYGFTSWLIPFRLQPLPKNADVVVAVVGMPLNSKAKR